MILLRIARVRPVRIRRARADAKLFFVVRGRDDPNLEEGFDFVAEVDADGVFGDFAKRTFETNGVGSDVETFRLERVDDFVGANGAVELAVGVRVRGDRNRRFGNLRGEIVEILEELTLLFREFRFVRFNNAAVVIGRDRRETLRNEVVLRVTRLHFDDVALLAKGIDRLNEKKLNSAVGTFRQTFASAACAARAFISNLHCINLMYSLICLFYQIVERVNR